MRNEDNRLYRLLDMADCTCNPTYLMHVAEAALGTTARAKAIEEIHAIAPNPFEQGRKNNETAWVRGWREHASRLIWC